ncbi:hypothetical protein SADUNF_Sadunf10G0128400 [Salix dunnii]|uniref:RING-CH-type domain-containing protein n=1 Tax=Salix dunnii TaxID=1413687 RepID=A0A835MS22_9ROSI|nr:hypothetical protein SADUNF_Sadunf10G0128400 [Salix dunnii]
MSDHVVLDVDRLIRPAPAAPAEDSDKSIVQEADVGPSCSKANEGSDDGISGEEEPLIQGAECRICQEEDSVSNLENPCACNGSLKYAHRKCVQHWCNEKGDITCEICHQVSNGSRQALLIRSYTCRGCGCVYEKVICKVLKLFVFVLYAFQASRPNFWLPYQPGYTAPPRPPHTEDTAIDIGGGWTISGTQLDLRDPRILAIAEAERHFLEAEYDDYAASNASGAAFCRSVALILMALLLLRHALTATDSDGEDDISTFFSLFLLRAAGFLLPCYIMAWAISILQRRRQRQEAAALAATQVAFVLQSGQQRGLQFTIAPGPTVTPHQEPV